MTKEEILEGNKLIAEFACIKNQDGSIYDNIGGGYPKGCMHFNLSKCPINTMYPFEHKHAYINNGEWNHDWSWLMPVVEVIEALSIYHSVEIVRKTCVIRVDKNNLFARYYRDDRDKISAVWLTVVEFIKWYNQNKT